MRMRHAIAAAICGAALAGALAGCGERPQVPVYQQGKYKGKPDTPPYANAPFHGDRMAWQRQIERRSALQNEYRSVR